MYKNISISIVLLSSFLFFSNGYAQTKVPAEFINNQIYVTPITQAGDTLRFLTDTGAGTNSIWEETVNELQLETSWLKHQADSLKVASFPDFKEESSIPVNSGESPFLDKLIIHEPEDFHRDNTNGMLGAAWYTYRIWEIDYANETVFVMDDIKEDQHFVHKVNLGFPIGLDGKRAGHHPSITIEVAGDSLDLLFDTGATLRLTENSKREFDTNDTTTAISYISESVFEKWKENYPEWKIIENGDKTLDMSLIQVPKISVANIEVGSVWFAMRPDKQLKYMSRMMDREVFGALGGSALKYFKIRLNYPEATAEFQKVK